MATELIIFILVVGIGSTIVLDLWGVFTAKIGWMPGTHWPSVGRWLLGIPAGHLVLDGTDTRPHTLSEAAVGWIFHYLIGLAYAVSFPLFWGIGFISAPTVFPVFLIGVIVSSLAGLIVLMPGMGGGIFARKLPNAGAMIVYVLVAHVIFAIAQYLLALLLA
ncbi:DUF2938 domain-containing protein [Pseudooceanicola sp. CBS1P-1]|uniref:DUF2938 family protein n=1 Tax=Pseudooceanicola albus TaxID=2692189 RepID=A0A6L7GCJ9_9RHOB|nr:MULTISPECIES: DUF2938 family protein [Pseudooceanicola]MBT9386858.1 DUF2938 domain-containing protein [Pseudooceanicola endophyticus]MXN21006.1 DUF2938 family protein [Pseudooceanicola albus]